MSVADIRCPFFRVFPGSATLQRGFEAGLEPGVPRGRALAQQRSVRCTHDKRPPAGKRAHSARYFDWWETCTTDIEAQTIAGLENWVVF